MRQSDLSLSAQPPACTLRNALRGSWGSASEGDNGLQRCETAAARSRNVVSAGLLVLGPAQAVVRTFCKRLGPAQRVVRTFCKRLLPAQDVVRTFCKRLGPAQRVVRTFCKRRLPALTLCGGGHRASGLATAWQNVLHVTFRGSSRCADVPQPGRSQCGSGKRLQPSRRRAQAAGSLLHRDLKPANVLLAESAEGVSVKLADFGISILSAELSGSQHGTGAESTSDSSTVAALSGGNVRMHTKRGINNLLNWAC